MVPAAFSVAGTCVFIGSVCSGVPGWLFPVGCSRLVVPGWLFPVGCSRLVVPGWLFLFGSCCFRPVAGYSRPASVVPARLRLFPPGFGCSCAVSGCSRLVVPVRLWLFLPRLRLPFLDFSCPAPALLPPPRLCCPRPASVVPVRLSELPAAAVCRKKAECLCRSVFFIYLRVSFRAGGNLPIFVRL